MEQRLMFNIYVFISLLMCIPVAVATTDEQKYSPLPGLDDQPTTLLKQLAATALKKQNHYQIRTEHHNENGQAKYINRLILEDSPYLLQHAHNPVNWFAWGHEAFEKAKRENKPIFLSIGYSTCHWCHVMEKESFEDVEIATFVNQHFVSIKIDRERRPDLDEIYMTGVQLISGHRGWPMSSFLTPEGQPFYGGTYFPPAQFLTLVKKMQHLWQTEQLQLQATAIMLTKNIQQISLTRGKTKKLNKEIIESAIQNILAQQDPQYGGRGSQAKFPQESTLLFLLDYTQHTANLESLSVVEKQLLHMANGGIYDQIAGGFHRYTLDAKWLTPHFEKMLYTQALLAQVYMKAFTLTLVMDEHWHINAHQPLSDNLIATQLILENGKQSPWQIIKLNYPAANLKSLGFQQQPVSIYEQEIQISGIMALNSTASFPLPHIPLQLTLQACNQTTCLAPQSLQFRLSPHVVSLNKP